MGRFGVCMEARIRIRSAVRGMGAAGRTTVEAVGTYAERNGSYYARYKEPAGSGLEGAATTIKWNEAFVAILRSEPYAMRQEFVQDQTWETVYRTPYLSLPLRVRTRRLAVRRRGAAWIIQLEYDSVLGGEESILAVTIEVTRTERAAADRKE